jgi:plastocyanin
MSRARMRTRPVLLALALGLGLGCAGGNGAGAGGADAAAPTFNGCAPGSFASGTDTVSFGGQGGSPLFGYAPACLRVGVGGAVTFRGDFSVHPISPGTSPTTTTAGTGNNPIAATASGMSLAVTFSAAGTYPYFCEMHYAAGMAGVILVE